MSCCCKKEVEYRPVVVPGTTGVAGANCCCSFPLLVILILIVLVFSRYGKGYGHDCKHSPVGTGILFIIALFFLVCCNPCKPGVGAGFGAY